MASASSSPFFSPEPKPFIALHDNFVNKFAEPFPVKAFQEIRPSVKDVQHIPCLGDGFIAASIQEPFLFQLCCAELFCQLIGSGYKNITVHKPLLLQLGQGVTLTGEIGYLLVQFHYV